MAARALPLFRRLPRAARPCSRSRDSGQACSCQFDGGPLLSVLVDHQFMKKRILYGLLLTALI
ncbi:MAG: hypothetical protein DME18_08665, partial [Verrucomicrobia bacterium]